MNYISGVCDKLSSVSLLDSDDSDSTDSDDSELSELEEPLLYNNIAVHVCLYKNKCFYL